MAKAAPRLHHGGNFLLSSLPASEYRDLAPVLDRVSVEAGQVIYRQGRSIDHVYFPATAILSWVGATRMGERAEVGLIGWEGVLGIPELLGGPLSPHDAEVALGGEVLRLEAARVKEVFERLKSLQGLLYRHSCAAFTQLAQASVCGLYHTVEQRLCRWLLTVHDRVNRDELLLTQEILAGMIGARRPTVSIVSGKLQKARLIRVNRGRITLLDRAGIEDATCECYRVIRGALDLLLQR